MASARDDAGTQSTLTPRSLNAAAVVAPTAAQRTDFGAAALRDGDHEPVERASHRDLDRANGRPAPAAHGLEQSALGNHRNADGRIVERTHGPEDLMVITPGLNRERALRGRGWHRGRVE